MAQDAAQHVHHDAFRDFSFTTRRKPQHLHYLPFKTLLTRSATDNYQAWLEHLYPFAPGEDYPFPEGQTLEEQILTSKRLKDQVLRWGASDPNFKNGRVAQWVQEAWERLKKAAEDGSDLMILEVMGTYPMLPKPDWGKQETALEINTKTINHKAESDIARRALLYKLFMEPPYTLRNSQAKRYADIPYSELLRGGRTGVMLGIYELAFGSLPNFTCTKAEKDFLIQEQDRIIKRKGLVEAIQWIHSGEYKHLIPLIDEWVQGARDRIRRSTMQETRLTLTEIVRADEPIPTLPCLDCLWIHVCQRPLSFISERDTNNTNSTATTMSNEIQEELTDKQDEEQARLTLNVKLDDFDEAQVYYGNQPFLKRGTAKHDVLLGIINRSGIANISDIQAETGLDESQFENHVKAINRDFKKLNAKQGTLISTKSGKVRVSVTLEKYSNPTGTQS